MDISLGDTRCYLLLEQKLSRAFSSEGNIWQLSFIRNQINFILKNTLITQIHVPNTYMMSIKLILKSYLNLCDFNRADLLKSLYKPFVF